MNAPENAHLLIFPALVLLVLCAIVGLTAFLAWDYRRDRRRRRA